MSDSSAFSSVDVEKKCKCSIYLIGSFLSMTRTNPTPRVDSDNLWSDEFAMCCDSVTSEGLFLEMVGRTDRGQAIYIYYKKEINK